MKNELVKNRNFKTDYKSHHPDIANQKIYLSRNLILRKNCETGELLINRLSSAAIKSSKSLLNFLSGLRRKSVLLSALLAEYDDNDLSNSITTNK